MEILGRKLLKRYKDTKNMHALTASDLHVLRMKKYATKQDVMIMFSNCSIYPLQGTSITALIVCLSA